MKRISFKKLVTKQIKLLAARYLTSLKLQHSKSEHLIYSEDMQPYLRNESLKIEEKKLMFKIRNRLIDVKSNFKKKYKDNLICRLCEMAEESQSHLVNCTVILGDSSIVLNQHLNSIHTMTYFLKILRHKLTWSTHSEKLWNSEHFCWTKKTEVLPRRLQIYLEPLTQQCIV